MVIVVIRIEALPKKCFNIKKGGSYHANVQ